MALAWILIVGATIAFTKVVCDLIAWRNELLQREREDALDRAMAETDE